MKKFFIMLNFILLIVSYNRPVQSTQAVSDIEINYLQNEIARLEKQLEQKTEKLNKCAEKNQNFKIAGIATVGLAGVGVATNITLGTKLLKQVKQGNQQIEKIEKTNEEWKKFEQEQANFYSNLDRDCFYKEMGNQLTEKEMKRLLEMDTTHWKISELSAEDKAINIKLDRIARQCQK